MGTFELSASGNARHAMVSQLRGVGIVSRARGQGGEGKEGASRMFDLLQIGERAPEPEDASLAPKEFPLFLDGSERMRFRYAVFLLNKVKLTALRTLASYVSAQA